MSLLRNIKRFVTRSMGSREIIGVASQRAAAPLMIALGARVINNSGMTAEQTSGMIITDVKRALQEREKRKVGVDG